MSTTLKSHSLRARTRALLIAILLAFVSSSALAAPRAVKGGGLDAKARTFARQISRALKAQKWRGVKIYYHADLDGVLTAKAM